MQKKKIRGGVALATVVIIICVIFITTNIIVSAVRKKTEKVVENGGVPVVAAIAEDGEITDMISQAGSIQSRSSVDVFAKVPGKIIKEILVETGAHVKRGDILASLENETVIAKLEEAKAELNAAESGVKMSDANLEVLIKDKARLENLLAEKAVAARQVDQVIAQYKSAAENKKAAQAKIEKAKAAIRQLQIAKSDHIITAPISGTVTKRYVDPGAMSSPAIPVVRISEETALKIVTTITQKDLPKIKKDMKAFVSIDAFPGEKFEGKIDIVSDEVKPESRMSEIEVNLDNRDSKLKPGMFAKISIILGKRQGTLISKDALLRLPGTGSFYVFAIENGKAVQKNVVVGIQEKDKAEILSGMKTGEKVVIQGHNRLRDGDHVKTSEKGKEAS